MTQGSECVRIHDRKAIVMNPNTVCALEGTDQTSLDASPAASNNGSQPANGTAEIAAEELDYRLVPPRSVVRAAVRYRVRGRGRPLPYPLDSETDE